MLNTLTLSNTDESLDTDLDIYNSIKDTFIFEFKLTPAELLK